MKALTILFVALVAACGSGAPAPATVSTDSGTEDVATESAAPIDAGAGCAAPPNAMDASVDASCVVLVVAEDQGGGLHVTPPGSECVFEAAKYTWDVAAHSLAWSRCVDGPTPSDPYKQMTGTHVVTADEAAAIAAALADVRIAPTECATDWPTKTVTVSSAGVTRAYTDNLTCITEPKLYATGVDTLLAKLAEITR